MRDVASGSVLVESKWGRLGRFVHLARRLCYNAACEFYHSERRGHRLAAVAPSAGSPVADGSPFAHSEGE